MLGRWESALGVEGKAKVRAPHTVPGPKSPLCPKIETHHILECVLPGEGRQRIPEALVCTVCKADACPTGKDPQEEAEELQQQGGRHGPTQE